MKLKIILNPRSRNGTNRYLVPILREKFAPSLVGIELTTRSDHASDVARRAIKQGVDTIVAVGGDGTVNAVLNGIAGTDVALGIIPTGTANDLASLYGVPGDASEACDIILERRIHCADLIGVNGRYYGTAGGLGLPCRVAAIANEIKRHGMVGQGLQHTLGSKLYLLAALYEVLKKAPRGNVLSIRWNGCAMSSDALALTIANQPFLGKHFLVSPGAVNDDGLFDICLIERPKSRVQTLSTALKTLSGGHVDSPYVKTWRASDLMVEAAKPATFFGDGEVFDRAREFRIKIFPHAVNVIAPKGKTAEA